VWVDNNKRIGCQMSYSDDMAKCMYCGICSEVCPTKAIRHSQEFEGACYDPVAMARHFALDSPVALFKPTKGGETDSALARKVEIGKDYMDVFPQPKMTRRGFSQDAQVQKLTLHRRTETPRGKTIAWHTN
jgi:formate hydrogenlyase subunit 6/NADH:ubiquinone oxidoreductase subunit I